MRLIAGLAVFLLIGCGPSGAPKRQDVTSIAPRTSSLPHRPQKDVPTAPTGVSAVTGTTGSTGTATTVTATANTKFQEQNDLHSFEILPLHRGELADTKRPIEFLAARIDGFMPGLARQLRWVMNRPIETYRGSLTALVRESHLKFMTRVDQLQKAEEVLHHERGLLFAYDIWSKEDSAARTQRLLTAILDHLLKFEVGEKLYCESYKNSDRECEHAWEQSGRHPKASKFAMLKTVSRALLEGNDALMNTTALMGLLQPFGYIAPYLTQSTFTGEQITSALRELDGKSLSPVKITGDRADEFGARSECRFRLLPKALQVEIVSATDPKKEQKWDFEWTYKNEDQFTVFFETGKPQFYRFYATSLGVYAEAELQRSIGISPVQNRSLQLKIHDVVIGETKGRITTIFCGESAP